MKKTAAVITVSDRSHRGEREDLSGPAVVQALQQAGFEIAGTEIVPDEREKIRVLLERYVERTALIVTTGGTGVARRDVTPEATEDVCERLIPGIPEVMRSEGLKNTAMSPLSRAVCGVRGSTLLLNLPGNPKGAVDSLQSVLSLVVHAMELLAGKTDHS
jgi:molybdenum cofactor synthesis domain-containing protein